MRTPIQVAGAVANFFVDSPSETERSSSTGDEGDFIELEGGDG